MSHLFWSRLLYPCHVRGRKTAKRTLDRTARLRVAPLLALHRVQLPLLGDERAYLSLSERAAGWPGLGGECLRRALHRGLGTPIGEDAILRYGVVLQRQPLAVGARTVIGHFTVVQHARIGDDTLIARCVTIADGPRGHNIHRLDVPIWAQGGTIDQVTVGSDCLVGDNVVILADVGDHCVVGAGSVVTRPVPDWSVVAGVPARIIGDRRRRAADGPRPLGVPPRSGRRIVLPPVA